jgi:hypothetical protein
MVLHYGGEWRIFLLVDHLPIHKKRENNQMNTETENALELYDKGIPVTIESAVLRSYLQNHRWGKHSNQQAKGFCPACDREASK